MSDREDDQRCINSSALFLVTMLLLPLVFSLLALSSCWGGWCCYAVASELWFTPAYLSWQYVRLRNPQIPILLMVTVWIGFTAGMITEL